MLVSTRPASFSSIENSYIAHTVNIFIFSKCVLLLVLLLQAFGVRLLLTWRLLVFHFWCHRSPTSQKGPNSFLAGFGKLCQWVYLCTNISVLMNVADVIIDGSVVSLRFCRRGQCLELLASLQNLCLFLSSFQFHWSNHCGNSPIVSSPYVSCVIIPYHMAVRLIVTLSLNALLLITFHVC